MPFDYLRSQRNEKFEDKIKPHAREEYVRGLRERAAMLARLGHSRDDILRRLEQNVEWDFELATRLPDVHAELPALVDEVMRRGR